MVEFWFQNVICCWQILTFIYRIRCNLYITFPSVVSNLLTLKVCHFDRASYVVSSLKTKMRPKTEFSNFSANVYVLVYTNWQSQWSVICRWTKYTKDVKMVVVCNRIFVYFSKPYKNIRCAFVYISFFSVLFCMHDFHFCCFFFMLHTTTNVHTIVLKFHLQKPQPICFRRCCQ